MVLLRVFFIFFVLINFSHANDLLFYEKQSKISIKELAVNLKKLLKAVMKESGPVSAVEYCNIAALDITSDVSNQKNVFIKRTSLKLRNKNNMPDKWEIDVLNNFEKRKQNGENVMSLGYQEVYKDKNESFYRYMKAIPIGKVCLTCHGSNINPKLSSKLSELYPDDNAYNYKLGDIRGAFSVKIPLPN
jgi:hypothetical protein